MALLLIFLCITFDHKECTLHTACHWFFLCISYFFHKETMYGNKRNTSVCKNFLLKKPKVWWKKIMWKVCHWKCKCRCKCNWKCKCKCGWKKCKRKVCLQISVGRTCLMAEQLPLPQLFCIFSVFDDSTYSVAKGFWWYYHFFDVLATLCYLVTSQWCHQIT